jgi:predicted 3-demethylubiquinone-9 3-methyltransferase (glyoxalase superfamily)
MFYKVVQGIYSFFQITHYYLEIDTQISGFRKPFSKKTTFARKLNKCGWVYDKFHVFFEKIGL